MRRGAKGGSRFFMKQLGDNVVENGVPLNMGRKRERVRAVPRGLADSRNLPMPGLANHRNDSAERIA